MPPEPVLKNLVSTQPLSDELQNKIAAELDRMREDLEQIGVSLCVDDELAQRHCMPLQQLDELCQRSFWLAKLLRADNPAELVSDISLGTLARRLAD